MVSWQDVQQWSGAAMEPAVTALNETRDMVLGQADAAAASATPATWHGPAANKARAKLQRIGDGAELIAAEVAAARRAAIEAADAIGGVKRGIEQAFELAQRHSFTIYDSGDVSPAMCYAEDTAEKLAERERVRAEVVDRVQQTLRHAHDIDVDVSRLLRNILDGKLVDVSSNNAGSGTDISGFAETGAAAYGGSVLAPPPGASASDNAAWWASLSDAERKAMVTDRPGLVGPRDGLPTAARDTANRELLSRTKSGLTERLTDLRKDLADEPKGPGSRTTINDLNQQIAAVEGKLGGITAIEDRLNDPDGDYYLLGIDGNGDGQAIIARGNPDTATNVATYVPGTGSDLAGIEGGMDRSDRMHAAAKEAGSPSTAVITWYGYDAPDDIPAAISSDYADGASNDLAAFQEGLRVSHQEELPAAHNTLLGHSYGSTVIGHTAQADGGVATDDMVFVGSPGVGVDSAGQLNMPPEHVWATADPDDIVPDLPPHGTDPTEDDFGARVFKADSPLAQDDFGYETASHSHYWEPANPSLESMGEIIANKSDQVGA